MTTAEYMREYRERRKAGHGPIISCACGCGARFRKFDGHNKKARRFVQGHNGKGRKGHPQSAETRAKISAALRKAK
jgi:hypothetical protein